MVCLYPQLHRPRTQHRPRHRTRQHRCHRQYYLVTNIMVLLEVIHLPAHAIIVHRVIIIPRVSKSMKQNETNEHFMMRVYGQK